MRGIEAGTGPALYSPETRAGPAVVVDLAAVRLRRMIEQRAFGPASSGSQIGRAVDDGDCNCNLTFRSLDEYGFDISLHATDGRVHAWFGGLECEFETLAEAADWVGRARSDDYRLRIDYVASRPVQWTLEHVPADGPPRGMLASGQVSLLAEFSRKHTEYRRNGGRRGAAE